MRTNPQRKKQSKPGLNPKLFEFWQTPARNRILYGGRNSTKSWDAAAFAIYLAQTLRVRFLCARQLQNKIDESVYTLLKQQIRRFDMSDRFTILNNKIVCPYTESEFVFYGLWRHIDEIRSTEGIDVLWIEEGQSLLQSQWEILEPTIRNEGSQIWIIFNPQLSNDFVYQKFIVNTPERTIKRKINYDENPYLSETSLRVIEEKKKEDYQEYEHIYLGEPKTDDDSVIIKRSWINAAIDSHLKLDFEPTGPKKIGFDIADDGGDRCVNVFGQGSVCLSLEQWKANEDELLKSCQRTWNNAQQWDAKTIIYDGVGVGAFAGSHFKQINQDSSTTNPISYKKFSAGSGVVNPEKKYAEKITNKDMFSNLKAQCWWSVADRFRNTWDAVTNGTKYKPEDLISISGDLEDLESLKTELSTPKKDYDRTDKVKVESKKDLADREVNSPDLADAFVMCFAPISSARGFFDVLMDSPTT